MIEQIQSDPKETKSEFIGLIVYNKLAFKIEEKDFPIKEASICVTGLNLSKEVPSAEANIPPSDKDEFKKSKYDVNSIFERFDNFRFSLPSDFKFIPKVDCNT